MGTLHTYLDPLRRGQIAAAMTAAATQGKCKTLHFSLEVESDETDIDHLLAAVASELADQEHVFDCVGLGPAVAFRIAAVSWADGRVDAGRELAA